VGADTVITYDANDTITLTDVHTSSLHALDFAFGANTTLGYTPNSGNTGGTFLSATDGIHTANLALMGQYMASSFVAAITDPPLTPETMLGQP